MPRMIPEAASGKARKPTRSDASARRLKAGSPRLRWALRLSLSGLALAFLVGLGVLAWVSGWADRQVAAVESSLTALSVESGFRVEEVLVTGRQASDPVALLAALGADRGDPILAIDLRQSREDILALPWVREAAVRRRLPDTILIQISEREPLAIWQRETRLHLIDQEGTVVPVPNLRPFVHLPLVIGDDAPRQVADLLAALDTVPTLAGRVTASVRVSARRWDLHLDNGVRVHLPEDGYGAALERLEEMERESGLVDRDILAIDLRLGDRVVIQTSPSAHERRRLPGENT